MLLLLLLTMNMSEVNDLDWIGWTSRRRKREKKSGSKKRRRLELDRYKHDGEPDRWYHETMRLHE